MDFGKHSHEHSQNVSILDRVFSILDEIVQHSVGTETGLTKVIRCRIWVYQPIKYP